jgi:hypothetical protein
VYSKNYVSRKAKAAYNLEGREYTRNKNKYDTYVSLIVNKFVLKMCESENYAWDGSTYSDMLEFKMATGTYPTGSAHPYPQNFTRRVTRTHMRVKK